MQCPATYIILTNLDHFSLCYIHYTHWSWPIQSLLYTLYTLILTPKVLATYIIHTDLDHFRPCYIHYTHWSWPLKSLLHTLYKLILTTSAPATFLYTLILTTSVPATYIIHTDLDHFSPCYIPLGTRAKAVWRVLVKLQASILQGQQISFRQSSQRASPYRFTDLQILQHTWNDNLTSYF